MTADLTGQRFGRLVAIRPVGRTRWGNICWLTKCDCGKQKTCSEGKLRRGSVKSCGCLVAGRKLQRLTDFITSDSFGAFGEPNAIGSQGVFLTARVSPSLFDTLTKLALRRGVSRSEVVRQALMREVFLAADSPRPIARGKKGELKRVTAKDRAT